jgi:hypothetical protein
VSRSLRIETALAVLGGAAFTCISLEQGQAEQAAVFSLLTGFFLANLLGRAA